MAKLPQLIMAINDGFWGKQFVKRNFSGVVNERKIFARFLRILNL
jgi:hypothetical protein